jgi:squalene-hopene/tetraprenyl-beta-curcumene cyclase
MEPSSDARIVPIERHGAWSLQEDVSWPDEIIDRAPVRRAIRLTRQWLLSQQEADGHWCAELEGDTILESETILLLAFLNRECTELARRASEYLVEKQLPGGGWAMYPGGDVEISGSVKAYFALKLTGHDPSAEYMCRARRTILSHGGADAVNSFTRFYLALLGQIDYEQCPSVPPEAVLLPKWFPVNLYAMSSWSRAMLVPLSIISTLRPKRELPCELGIRELFLKEPKHWPPLRCPGFAGGTGVLSWDRFFRTIDKLLKWYQGWGVTPGRGHAMAAAERWILEHAKGSDGVGAIYPPIVWNWIALLAMGHAEDSPEVRYCERYLMELVLRNEETGVVRLQPCKSPVWDTAITVRALADSGVGRDSPAMTRAVDWLLDHQVTSPGDWSQTVNAKPGGWCFEYHNDFYPDSDDTAMVLMALHSQFDRPSGAEVLPPELHVVAEAASTADQARRRITTIDRAAKAIETGMAWMLAMQNDDGGWGAFDRNNNRQFLCYVPFADHNAMIDPSTPDLAARVLESLGQLGRRVGDPAVDRAVAYLRQSQQPDGSWFGRWGVNYVYGTWQSLAGLAAVGIPADDPAVVAGAQWLLVHQQPCGGWGESADSYAKPHLRGQGVPTASQTAWAVLGLIAAERGRHPAVARGVRWLVDTQQPDGRWEEREFTGTGFPRVFYLRYHYYPIYFPLMALARWAAICEE